MRALEQELRSAREATTSEDKSTAGDKHETGRAMMHLEQEKLHKQLAKARSALVDLQKIEPTVLTESASKGSLVETDKGSFLIAVGLGKVAFERKTYYVISVHSPIAIQLTGKKPGDSFKLNGISYNIRSVA
ncbi:MAG: 3-oxoacyl-ACP synthase [Flavobacteriales bacterium]|nr:3-oxoacyl-ACP synthase [Flavobacteriales bacterium]